MLFWQIIPGLDQKACGRSRAGCSGDMQATHLPLQPAYFRAIGFFDSPTSFSKRGSPRKGSQNGSSFNTP